MQVDKNRVAFCGQDGIANESGDEPTDTYSVSARCLLGCGNVKGAWTGSNLRGGSVSLGIEVPNFKGVVVWPRRQTSTWRGMGRVLRSNSEYYASSNDC